MKSTWNQQDREAAYTSLCEALTDAGRAGETLLLARLALLLAEELSDPAAFARALAAAALPQGNGTVASPRV
jgi:hypothetical protein